MVSRFAMTMALSALAFGAWAEAPKRGVPSGCDPSVMSGDYWSIWNAEEQARIDADIEQNRKATAVSLMFERLANPDLLPREVFLSAKLVERESTSEKACKK